MVTPAFGFSVGDFIACINLVRSLSNALNDGAGAKVQYRRLIAELINLERALTEVRHLQVEDSQASQKIALEQAALQCQESIEGFLRRNAKFKPTLGAQTTSSKWSWRSNLYKIQWALCQEDAVDKLRAEITGHTLTINTLLTMTHLSATALQTELAKSHQEETKEHRKATDETQSLVKRSHELLSTQADLITTISQVITTCSTSQQTEELQSIMLKVLDTNMKIYKMVLDMQKLQFQLPAQIDRQQPIYFKDAHGRIAPFHIEFINSFDAFQAVMEVRFRHVPGLKKVQNVEYAIQESRSKRKLDLTAPWDSIFLPGRKVNMSMVFRRPLMSMSSCPGCQTENEIEEGNEGSEIQCSNSDCKIWYQRVIEMDTPREGTLSTTTKIQLGKRKRNATPLSSRKKFKQPVVEGLDHGPEGVTEDEDEDEIHQFRRVHVVHKKLKKPMAAPSRVVVDDYDNISTRPNDDESVADDMTVPSASSMVEDDRGDMSEQFTSSTTPHNTNMSPFGSPSPKSVTFELLFPESPQYRARLPMRVQIFPHDTTDAIVTTVKNFYGLYVGPGGAKGVSFEDEQGNNLIARYENLRNNMVVYVRVIEEPEQPTSYGKYEREEQIRKTEQDHQLYGDDHCNCLQKWRGSGCPVCRHTNPSLALSSSTNTSIYPYDPANPPFGSGKASLCSVCDCTDDLWICLICGNVGCGRYRGGHAKEHWKDSAHNFSLEIETQHVWDYARDMWVHRLIRDKGDSKVIELPSSSRSGMGIRGGRDVDIVPREKLEGIGMEYTHLLTSSQLESRRVYFEELVEKAVAKASAASTAAAGASQRVDEAISRLGELEKESSRLLHDPTPV